MHYKSDSGPWRVDVLFSRSPAMEPSEESHALAVTLAAELEGMAEEDRLRARRILEFLVANLEVVERRVRRLEERTEEG
jgi:hypothetical protein